MNSLEDNYRTLDQLTANARERLMARDLEAAAVTTQMAGRFAWLDHPGVFSSPGLESVLTSLREQIPDSTGDAPKPAPGGRRKILHVATQLYGTGGHTQTVARWIGQDAASEHSIALTRQGSAAIPDKIYSAIGSSERLFRLDLQRGGLVERARLLRQQVSAFDFVVVHAHPYDVVPAVALGSASSPPCIYVNHADHVFWLGTSAAHVVMNLRESGRALCVARRGIDETRCVVVDRPLDSGTAEISDGSRLARREAMGIGPQDVLIVSAAAGSKYERVGDIGLIELVKALLKTEPNVVFCVAGPVPEGQWAEAAVATDNRIRAIGPLPTIAPLLEAADIYVDSFPFSSLTSLLEAGGRGLPLVTYRGHSDECAVLGADSPGLDDVILAPTNPNEFHSVMRALVSSRDKRSRDGDAARQAVLAGHDAHRWAASMEDLYTKAALSAGRVSTTDAKFSSGPLDVLVEMIQRRTGFAGGVAAARAEVAGLQRAPERVRSWFMLRSEEIPIRIGQLLPEWLLFRLAVARNRARQWFHGEGRSTFSVPHSSAIARGRTY